MTSAFGCGEWRAYIVGRGGSPTLHELPYSNIRVNRKLNAAGNATVSIPNSADARSACCDILNDVEPWKDEVLLYRENYQPFVGPLQTIQVSQEGATFQAQDLFIWMDQRFIEDDFHGDGDVADIFHAIFDLVYAKDTSPNIDISTRVTGVRALRNYKGDEFHRAADVMRELARTGLDFTVEGRAVLAGALESYLSTTQLILHDDGVVDAEVTREGTNFATDVAVFGATEKAGMAPVIGRAVRASARYGLIQRSFTELTIRDNLSADSNAEARVLSMQPAPLRVNASLSPNAAFGAEDAIPGRRVDVRLREAAGCVEIVDEMRLQEVDYEVTANDQGISEKVSVQIIPLGLSDGD